MIITKVPTAIVASAGLIRNHSSLIKEFLMKSTSIDHLKAQPDDFQILFTKPDYLTPQACSFPSSDIPVAPIEEASEFIEILEALVKVVGG